MEAASLEQSSPAPLAIEVILLRPGARLPERASAAASGFDLRACIGDGPADAEGAAGADDAPPGIEVGLAPVRIPTGVAIAAPPGSDVQIRPRSGLSARGVMATFGTIDADYRGELFVTLYCLPSTGSHTVRDGDRIAQLVVSRLAEVEWRAVEALDDTARGAAGHGSTGSR